MVFCLKFIDFPATRLNLSLHQKLLNSAVSLNFMIFSTRRISPLYYCHLCNILLVWVLFHFQMVSRFLPHFKISRTIICFHFQISNSNCLIWRWVGIVGICRICLPSSEELRGAPRLRDDQYPRQARKSSVTCDPERPEKGEMGFEGVEAVRALCQGLGGLGQFYFM